jgi:hypothetical protein
MAALPTGLPWQLYQQDCLVSCTNKTTGDVVTLGPILYSVVTNRSARTTFQYHRDRWSLLKEKKQLYFTSQFYQLLYMYVLCRLDYQL